MATIVLESSLSDAWVDFTFTGVEDGSQSTPYDSVYEAVHVIESAGTLTIVAGESAVTPHFTKAMTIVADGGVVTLGRIPAMTVSWPITGGTEPVGPLSSTFGSRLKASENFRYDFHRGIDIPTPAGTNIRAIADGVVRVAGDHPSYSDMIVQITHTTDDGVTYYSNSIHMSSVFVSEDDMVKRGDIIGQSGVGAGGFPHLHFETRLDGLFQRNCVSPFGFLPYDDDRTAPELTFDLVDVALPTQPQITVTVSIPRINDNDALDFNSVTVTTGQDDGNSITLLDTHTFALNEWNFDYTPLPPDDANTNLDSDSFNGVVVAPAQFNASSESYDITMTFTDLIGPANPAQLVVTAVAKDLWGHTREVQY